MSDIILSAAQTATLAGGGTLTIQGTKAATGTPPPVKPPVTPPSTGDLPQTGNNVIYNGAVAGKEMWPGDWDGSGATANYNDTLNGLTVMSVLANEQWPFWLPFAPLVGGPQGNTPTFDPTGYSFLTLIMKPTGGNSDTVNVGAYTYTVANGQVQPDIATGGTTAAQWAVGGPDANGLITYKIPLSVMKVVNPLYKIIVQDSNTPVGQKFYVRYAAFTK